MLLCSLLLGTTPLLAADCSVSSQGVSFGSYDPTASQDLESAGNIDVSCDVPTPSTVTLSSGSGSYANRTLRAGAYDLYYNLYTDATHTIVWGDGSGATASVPGDGVSSHLTVYGRIPAGQNGHVGSYVDSIVVTLTY